MPATSADMRAKRADLRRALGARLSQARRSAGLTQVEAARRLGVPQSQVAKLELGRRTLTYVEALDMAEAYGIHPLELDPR